MISSEEFQQKLQSGQIHQALALVSRDPTLLQRGFTHELDVTTRRTQDPTANAQSTDRQYLRTKVNLLTGEIHNEVCPDLVGEPSSDLAELQQLHINQIVASYRIVQGHLDRVKAILTALLPSTSGQPQSSPTEPRAAGSTQLTAESLATRLTQSSLRDRRSGDLDEGDGGAIGQQQQSVPSKAGVDAQASSAPTVESDSFPDLETASDESDREIDLSIHADNEIWEEWVEDDDFRPESVMPQPATGTAELQLPDLQEHWVRRSLGPSDVKPLVPRSAPISIDSAAQWDKFVPEYIEIDTATQSHPSHDRDEELIARRLADLERTSRKLQDYEN